MVTEILEEIEHNLATATSSSFLKFFPRFILKAIQSLYVQSTSLKIGKE